MDKQDKPDDGYYRTLDNACTADSFSNIKDLKKVGRPDGWKVICKSSSEQQRFFKTTKALHIPGRGCLVQTSTRESAVNVDVAISDSLAFIPGVRLVPDPEKCEGHRAGYRFVRMSLLERLWWEFRSTWSFIQGFRK